ncbi:kinase-like domain-containing protein, partial [Mycena rebaudengoi]
ELWHSVRHRNVVEVLGVSSFDADPQYIVTPFHPNGNVVRYLERNPDVDRANIILDAALGMQYLHARKLAHGSLKPTNILIADDGRACIADCGMAEIHSSGSEGHRYFSPEAWKGVGASRQQSKRLINQSADSIAFLRCICVGHECS